jgi:hypothetical protein
MPAQSAKRLTRQSLGGQIKFYEESVYMSIFTIAALLLSVIILLSRTYLFKISNFTFHFIIGVLKGTPYFISAILLLRKIDFGIIVFIIAIAFDLYFGKVIDHWFEKRSKQNTPEQWKEWENTRSKHTTLIHLLLLIG